MQGIEQLEPLRGKVFEECRQIVEIEPLDRLLRTPAGVQLSGYSPRFGKELGKQ